MSLADVVVSIHLIREQKHELSVLLVLHCAVHLPVKKGSLSTLRYYNDLFMIDFKGCN